MKFLRNLLTDNRGAATTEYALLIALVAIAVVAAVLLFQEQLVDTFTRIADALRGADANAATKGGGTHARPIAG